MPDCPQVVRGGRCPCDCDGNGSLVYLSCPQCGKVVLVCDETGNVFDNLREPLASAPLVLWRSAGQRCPECKQIALARFQLATADELTRAGIPGEDYEAGDVRVGESVRRLALG
jgi:hypothetical protein